MEKRTVLYEQGDTDGIRALEKELLLQNAEHKDWEATEALMVTTKQKEAMYMHCLPADIADVSCKEGEVAATVFAGIVYPFTRRRATSPISSPP